MSARPESFGFNAAMTFPMSWLDLAPVAAIASVTAASTSVSLKPDGM